MTISIQEVLIATGETDVLVYKNKTQLIDSLRSAYGSSGMGYRPGYTETVDSIIAGMNHVNDRYEFTRVSMAVARAQDASWATNGLPV
jgi:hypothetical protein